MRIQQLSFYLLWSKERERGLKHGVGLKRIVSHSARNEKGEKERKEEEISNMQKFVDRKIRRERNFRNGMGWKKGVRRRKLRTKERNERERERKREMGKKGRSFGEMEEKIAGGKTAKKFEM